jgi:tetratricopeptide (TPR) repeat protein
MLFFSSISCYRINANKQINKKYDQAKQAYEHVLSENPEHAKVLQQLGWLYHQPDTGFFDQALAIDFLLRSLKVDEEDPQSWYLVGRCYMAAQNYNKAYDSYQQAVYRDGRNPIFWCSIGVLYYQISQKKDALDAYSRAIRLNPYISEVWFNLGTLYDSCGNQVQDARDAYQKAAELDPDNPDTTQRLESLNHHQQEQDNNPSPRDVTNPSQYQHNRYFDQKERSDNNNEQRQQVHIPNISVKQEEPISPKPSMSRPEDEEMPDA